MSPGERQLRSALNQLLSQHGLVHGTLVVRRRVCGKPNCRCASGQPHAGLYLIVTEQGRGRQMYVPRRLEAEVRRWIDNYGQARGLLDDLSRLHWDKVRQRQD
jgi:hypothetical protein